MTTIWERDFGKVLKANTNGEIKGIERHMSLDNKFIMLPLLSTDKYIVGFTLEGRVLEFHNPYQFLKWNKTENRGTGDWKKAGLELTIKLKNYPNFPVLFHLWQAENKKDYLTRLPYFHLTANMTSFPTEEEQKQAFFKFVDVHNLHFIVVQRTILDEPRSFWADHYNSIPENLWHLNWRFLPAKKKDRLYVKENPGGDKRIKFSVEALDFRIEELIKNYMRGLIPNRTKRPKSIQPTLEDLINWRK